MALFLVSCGGSKSMSSPQIYSSSPNLTELESDSADTAAGKTSLAQHEAKKKAAESTAATSRHEAVDDTSAEDNYDNVVDLSRDEDPVRFFGEVEVSDSAAAVDDDIWRSFDLAEEYHQMGVLANREASWEEAQYYFEKSLKILAGLDVEADTSLTPEAAKYTSILDNVVADYRITLRSLGSLEEDVSSSVLIERFNDIERTLADDTMRVFQEERQQITYDLPVKMNDRVKKSIIYFQTVAKDAFNKYLRRKTRYEDMMLEIIRSYGLPEDLVYLSMIESGFNPHAYSWARAMGLWQFIASTGRLYDLDRSWWIDERKDPIKATHSACRFLKDLYEKFGDWELAMAAYNGGPGRVSRTIKSQGTRDFWKMRLKRQTMDYVPFIYAAAIIGKNPEKYGFTDIEYEDPILWDEVTINKCLDLKTVASEIGCSVDELQQLNPELLRHYTPPNTKNYKLKVPVGTKDRFWAAYEGMPSPKETSWVRHEIRRGETISTIAARYGVSQYAIMEANNMSRRSTIYAGKHLIVPVPLDRASAGGRSDREYSAKNSIYTVRRGDTMWDIARAFGTTVSALRRINYIERGSRIYVGQKMKIPGSATKLAQNTTSDSQRAYASSNQSAKTGSTDKTYTVRSGDTLWDIARRYGLTTAQLRILNGLGRSSRIYPGQKLAVSGSGKSIEYLVHRVRRGETLSRIARLYGTSISRIASSNNINDPNNLRVGEQLKIFLK